MNQTGMLRANGIHLPQGLNQPVFQNINTPHLIPQQSQPQPGHQPQGQPNPMSMLPSHANPTPAMSLLGGAQPNGTAANYTLQMQQANQVRRSHLVQQGMSQGLGVPPQPNLNGMAPTSMPFQNVRRVQSQPQGLNQVGAHGGGMHPVPQMLGGVPTMGSLTGMNPQQMQMRMLQQHQQQQPLQQSQLTGGQPGMQPELSMLRQGPHMSNPAAYVGRSTSSQGHPMRNLQASSSFPPALPTMQPQYPNPGMQHQQQPQPQQPQMATSPHPPHNGHAGQLPPNHQQGMQQPLNRARMTPEHMLFLQQQNQQMNPNLTPSGPRMQPTAGGTFPFPTSTPPNQMNDVQQSMSNGMNTPGSTHRLITPAQTLEQLQGNDGSFGMAPPQQVPPRPPSQQRPHPFPMHNSHTPHQTPIAAHSSPRQLDHHLGPQLQPQQRPQSQPQVQQGSPPRPQVGLARTPRMTQQPLNHNVGPPQPRIPTLSGQQPMPMVAKPPTPISGHVAIANSRPPPTMQQNQAGGPAAPPTGSAGPPPPPGPSAPQEPPPHIPPQLLPPQNNISPANLVQTKLDAAKNQLPVGLGQGISHILKFSATLAFQNMEKKTTLKFWDLLVREYFSSSAVLKITLWKDNRRDEAKPFEISNPVIPRFFLVTAQSGVKSMSLNLDGARERVISHTHAAVECTHATWTYHYTNGYIVTLRGPLTAHVWAVPSQGREVWSYRFDQLAFDANFHDKYLNMDAILGQRIPDSPRSPRALPAPLVNGNVEQDDDRRYDDPRCIIENASLPAEPVNAFGIPQATMRCLELAESVTQMTELIQFASENHLGPLESLGHWARKVRQEQGEGGMNGEMPEAPGTMNGLPTGPTSALYSAPPPPPPVNNPPPQAGPSQNAPPMGTPKPSKAMPPGQPQASGSTPGPSASTPAAAPTPTATNTPAMQPSTLKRKATNQGPDAPTSASGNDQQPTAKRPPRKRGRTTGGG